MSIPHSKLTTALNKPNAILYILVMAALLASQWFLLKQVAGLRFTAQHVDAWHVMARHHRVVCNYSIQCNMHCNVTLSPRRFDAAGLQLTKLL